MQIAMDELVALVGDVIELDPARIDVRSDRDEVPGWDSLAHLSIVTALEERCKVRLTMEQIVQVRTVEQLCRAVEVR